MFILAALVILIGLWLYLKPPWAPQPPDTRGVSARAERISERATERSQQFYTGLRGRLKFGNSKQELAQRFRQWTSESGAARARLAESLPGSSAGFIAWLSHLSDKEAETFSRDVAQFCDSQNFNIAWLNDPQVNTEPALKQAVEDAVLLYGVACWRAKQVQYDVKAVITLKAFLAQPERRDHKAFGQRLFSALADDGLVQIPPNLMTAPEKERVDYMANAIQQASQKHPNQFRLVLHHVVNLNGSDSALPKTPVTTPEPAAQTTVVTPEHSKSALSDAPASADAG